MKVKLIAIAALGKNREIGLGGKLPWHIPDEYAHYLKTVKDQYVVIGRKNFESNGGDVEGAYPLVLSRDPHFQSENALVFRDFLEVLSYAEDAELEKLYIVGGAEIYRLALPYLSEFLWTEVDYTGPADTYFPDFSSFHWEKISEETHSDWKLRHLVKIPKKLY
jgi:dihydrofolate reductase